MRSVRDIPILQNIPVLVRAACNVPVQNGEVVNDYRLRRALPTIRFLQEHGARVVLISHIGEEGTQTLEPVARALSKHVKNLSFCPSTIGEKARSAVRALAPGQAIVLENLRRDKREVQNDREFAKELASLADVFVQDSFDTCHRLHASIIGVPKLLPSYAGFLVEEEAKELGSALRPASPSLAVIGGAKFDTKESVLEALLAVYDKVFVGGALANDFLKASGQPIGASLISDAPATKIKKLLTNPKLAIPIDSIVVKKPFAQGDDAKAHARVAAYGDVQPDDVILDHGPATSAMLTEFVGKSKAVLWNGPLGIYERGFTDATDALARAIADSVSHSVVGGGDTIAAIERLQVLDRISFVSTGGGAMLDFLANGTLPGITALG